MTVATELVLTVRDCVLMPGCKGVKINGRNIRRKQESTGSAQHIKKGMASILGLAGYGSDHSDEDDNEDVDRTSHNPDGSASSSIQNDHEEVVGGPIAAGVSGTAELLEDSDSRLLADSNSLGGEDMINARTGAVRASSFDAPAPPSRESRQFFMPLPSPLVRLDNGAMASPFIPFDPNDGEGIEEDEAGAEGEDEDVGDGDIINPEYRDPDPAGKRPDMLPPEATGQANPQVQAKIAKYLDTMAGDFTKSIKGKKDFGNPAVLAQVEPFLSDSYRLVSFL